jgi:hypothetical protein
MTFRAAIAAAAVVAGTAAGAALAWPRASAPPLSGAAALARLLLAQEVRGEWAAQWRTLNPAHRALLSEHQFAFCSNGLQTRVPARFTVASARRVKLHTVLVTLHMREPGVAATTLHVHIVRAGNRWTWILAPAFVRAVEHGRCPDGEPLPSGPPA